MPAAMLPSFTVNDDRSLGDVLSDIEKELLKKAMGVHGSAAAVAKHFKVDRVTIYRKLKRYGLI